MGRLFWKFFIFIWLVQLAGMLGVGASFWLRDLSRNEQNIEIQAGRDYRMPPEPPGPPPHRGPPPDGMHGPDRPPPPPPHPGLLPPIELVLANILVGLLSAALLAWYFSKPIRSLRSAFDGLPAAIWILVWDTRWASGATNWPTSAAISTAWRASCRR